MKKFYPYLFFLTILSFIGCRTVVEVDLPDYTPKLVVNGFFTPDTFWSVSLRKSVSVLETSQAESVKNALVTITSGTENFTLERFGDSGTYMRMDKRPKIGTVYTLNVQAPGFPGISAQNAAPSQIPEIVSVDTIQYIKDYGDGWTENQIELTLTFKDNANTEDFYYLEVYDKLIYEGETQLYKKWFSSSSPAIISSNPGGEDNAVYNGRGAMFNDAVFSDENQTIKLTEIPKRNFSGGSQTLHVVLYTVSEELFLYSQNENRSTDDAVVLFSEPEPAYTNIQNGLGIFAGYRSAFFEVK